MRKIAEFIVDKRKLFLLIFLILIVYSVVCIPKTVVSYDIAAYLPDNTDTKKAIDIMGEEFVSYASPSIMVKNVTYKNAEALSARLSSLEEVRSVTFDDTESHYKSSSALYNVSLYAVSGTAEAKAAIVKVKEVLADYDYVMLSGNSDDMSDMLTTEMTLILILAVCVIAVVLFMTSKSYAEIMVFPIVFSVAALLNMGTNYLLPSISYITNSVAIVLQLALAIDYAIIMCHRFTDELDKHDAREACVIALSKAIPEISASSLTTVSGLVALMFMQLRLGFDIGMVMTKGIICSMLTVFLLMPALLMMFSNAIKKTQHRSFMPKAKKLGVFAVKSRYVLPCIFLVLVLVFAVFQQNAVYAFSYSAIDTDRPSKDVVTQNEMNEVFGRNAMLAVLVPKGDYKREARVIKLLEEKEMVTGVTGLANVKINDDYTITTAVTYRQFANILNISSDSMRLAYLAYGIANDDYSVITYIDEYQIPIIDMFEFIIEERESGLIRIEGETGEKLDELTETLQFAKSQLVGENYSRIAFTIDGVQESPETYAFLEEVKRDILEIYDEAILVGDATSSYDLSSSFSGDNMLISVMTIVFIVVILLFTFKSASLPILLVLVIQGTIWINFGIPAMMSSRIFFFAYLVISAIQMGATIDYAILITSRYMELKLRMDKKSAAMLSVSQCFTTILTSGTIMTAAGFLLGIVSSDPTIGGIGVTLGRGTLISVLSVLFVLPGVLVLFDGMIKRTSFEIEIALPQDNLMVNSKVNGRIRGYVNGYIDADMKGFIKGEMRANLAQIEQAEIKNAKIVEKDKQEPFDEENSEYEKTAATISIYAQKKRQQIEKDGKNENETKISDKKINGEGGENNEKNN